MRSLSCILALSKHSLFSTVSAAAALLMGGDLVPTLEIGGRPRRAKQILADGKRASALSKELIHALLGPRTDTDNTKPKKVKENKAASRRHRPSFAKIPFSAFWRRSVHRGLRMLRTT